MGFTDDILALPFGLKLLLGFVLALGGSIKFIPFVDLIPSSATFGAIIWYGLGEAIFTPFTLIFNFVGITFTWDLFVILYGVIMVLYFTLWIIQFTNVLNPKRAKR